MSYIYSLQELSEVREETRKRAKMTNKGRKENVSSGKLNIICNICTIVGTFVNEMK